MRIKALERDVFNNDFVYFFRHEKENEIFKKYNIKSTKNNEEDYYYEIDEEKFDLENFKKEFENKFGNKYEKEISEFEKRFKNQVTPKVVNFEDLSACIRKNIYNLSQKYTVIGDVVGFESYDDYSSFTLVFDNNAFKTLKVYVENQYIPNEYNFKNMNEQKEVMVTGNIKFNNNMQFYFSSTNKIEILGESKRLKQINEWKQEIENRGLKKQYFPFIQFEKIGLITKNNSQGHKDFKNILGDYYYDQYISDLTFKDIAKFNANEIIKAIKELNKENNCDIIIIVSAGGNPYWLLEFSKPELLEAIADVEDIPIVTGIAHSGDNLLCNEISAYNAKTPTGAAEYIKMLIGAKHKQYRDERNLQSEKRKNDEIDKLKTEIQQKDEKIQELKDKILELRNQLYQKNSRGLFGRIFNT